MMANEPEYIAKINSEIRTMLNIVEDLGSAVQAALEMKRKGTKDAAYAASVNIQHMEEEVTALCVGSLIRYQPFASDLRAITVALKVSYDLSRICRYLYNITEVLEEFDLDECDVADASALLNDARSMVSMSLAAYFDKNRSLASEIIERDHSIDERYRMILSAQRKSQSKGGDCILLNGLTARIIERLADHACYISSETTYLVTGRRVGYR
jgi:phosphate transport system protein